MTNPVSSPGATPPPPLSSTPRPQDPKETARTFEAVFLGQMAKMMMETVEIGDQFSGGHGEEMFRGVLAERLGEEMARQGGIGLAPAVLDQIIKMQGGAGNGH